MKVARTQESRTILVLSEHVCVESYRYKKLKRS